LNTPVKLKEVTNIETIHIYIIQAPAHTPKVYQYRNPAKQDSWSDTCVSLLTSIEVSIELLEEEFC